ncbi:hypothetical protein HKD37_07G019716 [Glycine soja]
MTSRIVEVKEIMGYNMGFFPFCYLGVRIFQGCPKKEHFQPIVDKIMLKLAKWKGALLSIIGHMELIVESIIQEVVWLSLDAIIVAQVRRQHITCKTKDSNAQTILQTCASAHSKQVLDVPISAIIHLLWFILELGQLLNRYFGVPLFAVGSRATWMVLLEVLIDLQHVAVSSGTLVEVY